MLDDLDLSLLYEVSIPLMMVVFITSNPMFPDCTKNNEVDCLHVHDKFIKGIKSNMSYGQSSSLIFSPKG